MSDTARRQACTVKVSGVTAGENYAVQTAEFSWQDGVFIAPLMTNARADVAQHVLEAWTEKEGITFKRMCAYSHTQLPSKDTHVLLRADTGLILAQQEEPNSFTVAWQRRGKAA